MRGVGNRTVDDEAGVVLPVTMVLMVAVLSMGALAVDLTNQSQHGQQLKAAADAAVLAAAQELDGGEDVGAAVATAKEYVLRNADIGAQQWVGCRDADALPVQPDVVANDNECISFSADHRSVRVRVPTRDVDTVLAGVMGIDQVAVSGVSQASASGRGSANGVLPFGLTSTAADAGGEVCLKTGPSGHAPFGPCDGSVSGNFGTVDILRYADGSCGQGSTHGRAAINMALGADHDLAAYEVGGVVVADHLACPDDSVASNHVLTQPGNGNALHPGIVAGVDVDGAAHPGRLGLDGPGGQREVVEGGDPLDDTPIWDFVDVDDVTSLSLPASCDPRPIDELDDFLPCLSDYRANAPGVPLFAADLDDDGVPDLASSPRFAHVPVVGETLGNGNTLHAINRLQPIYLQSIFFSCNASSCSGQFTPGEESTGLPVRSNASTEALTAIVLEAAMIPEDPGLVASSGGSGIAMLDM